HVRYGDVRRNIEPRFPPVAISRVLRSAVHARQATFHRVTCSFGFAAPISVGTLATMRAELPRLAAPRDSLASWRRNNAPVCCYPTRDQPFYWRVRTTRLHPSCNY